MTSITNGESGSSVRTKLNASLLVTDFWGAIVPGTGVAAALAVNVGSAGAFVVNGGAGGTPSAITLTNGTGLPLTTGVTGTLPVANGGTGITSFGTGIATFLGTPSSANLASAVTDETGSGALVFGTSPTITTDATITGATVTSSAPALNITQTWNNGATTFTGLDLNITNTTSATGSKLAAFRVDGTDKVVLYKEGTIYLANTTGDSTRVNLQMGAVNNGLLATSTSDYHFVTGGFYSAFINNVSIRLPSTNRFGFCSGSSFNTSIDTGLARDAAGIMEINNGSTGTLRDLKLRNLIVPSSTGSIGYGTGSGGAVTQITSRTTGVTINTPTGAITLVSAAGSTTFTSFTVTNSSVAATDTVIVNQKSGTDLYRIHVTNVAAGSFRITFATTAGTTTEQPVFNFAVIKGVAA